MKRLLALLLAVLMLFGTAAYAAKDAKDAENTENAEESAVPFPGFGAVVTYGHYEQDENLDNGKEPIEWMVLDTEDEYVFLLSVYCLDTRIFNQNPAHSPCYWGKSKIRKWMNEDFLNAAFTPEEQEMIRTTSVKNTNPHGMRGGGADTQDKLYFLSRSEVLHYLPENEDRIAYPTAHAIATGCEVNEDNGACYWWLRTPGERNVDIQGVRPSGKVAVYGKQDVWWKTNTVRPCMWVNMTVFEDLLPENTVETLHEKRLMRESVVEAMHAAPAVEMPTPKVELPRSSDPYTYDMLEADFEAWSQLDVPWLKTEIIGETVEGRPLYAVTLGTGSVYTLCFAGIHGNELANTPIMMDGIADIIDLMQAGDEATAEKLSKVSLVLVPCANPDGYVYCLDYSMHNMFMGRKFNAAGVNLNRNFPTPRWGSGLEPGDTDYPGPEASSEPETKALVALMNRHPYSAMVDFHSKGQEVYYGKGGFAQEDVNTTLPVAELDDMNRRLAEAVRPERYRLIQIRNAEDGGFGSSTDYMFSLGVPSITIETVQLIPNEIFTPALILKEARRLKMPELLMKLCDVAVEFDGELHERRENEK